MTMFSGIVSIPRSISGGILSIPQNIVMDMNKFTSTQPINSILSRNNIYGLHVGMGVKMVKNGCMSYLSCFLRINRCGTLILEDVDHSS